jgi:hypothetical protein
MSKEEEDSSGGLALDESKPELKQPALFIENRRRMLC